MKGGHNVTQNRHQSYKVVALAAFSGALPRLALALHPITLGIPASPQIIAQLADESPRPLKVWA